MIFKMPLISNRIFGSSTSVVYVTANPPSTELYLHQDRLVLVEEEIQSIMQLLPFGSSRSIVDGNLLCIVEGSRFWCSCCPLAGGASSRRLRGCRLMGLIGTGGLPCPRIPATLVLGNQLTLWKRHTLDCDSSSTSRWPCQSWRRRRSIGQRPCGAWVYHRGYWWINCS